MDERQRRREAGIAQVGIERRQLTAGEHPLVDERAGRERGEVDPGAVGRVDLALDPLADAQRAPVQDDAVLRRVAGTGKEDVAEAGHRLARHGADGRRLDRHVAPPEHAEALVLGDPLDRGHRLLRRLVVDGQEGASHCVPTGRRQLEIDHGPQELVGYLHRDARPVTVVRVGPRGAPVVEVVKGGQPELDHPMGRPPVQVDDERHPARVVLEGGVVQALRARRAGQCHVRSSLASAGWSSRAPGDDVGPEGGPSPYRGRPCRRATGGAL